MINQSKFVWLIIGQIFVKILSTGRHCWCVCCTGSVLLYGCSLTSVHVKIVPRTPSHPSHRTDLWQRRSHSRRCTSDRLTWVTARVQRQSQRRYSAVKETVNDSSCSTLFQGYLLFFSPKLQNGASMS